MFKFKKYKDRILLKVGLTGGIGCGKSTAVASFRELGAMIIDADQVARDIVEPGTKALNEIAQLFGDGILLENGALNRSKLGQIIFSPTKEAEQALANLEKITHPIISEEIKSRMDWAETQTIDYPYLFVDIPLLVEKEYESLFDRIVVVDCLVEQQIDRVKNRDGMNEESILQIIEQQATREQRQEVATDILDNSKDVEHLLSQVKQLHRQFVSLSDQ